MKGHLVLFFTRGVSLRTWAMVGMLEREIAIYRRLLDQGFQVTFLTYGDRTDLDYAKTLGNIRILCNQESLPLEHYEKVVLTLHGDILRTAHAFKTNQTYGSELALLAAKHLKKPLIARCGYLWSWNAEREYGKDAPWTQEARRVEDKVFPAAQRVVVTTEAMRQTIIDRLPTIAKRVVVIPNYVDTDCFRPLLCPEEPNTILFVGRIAPEKNLESLLRAIESLPVTLILIGEGRLRSELQSRFAFLDKRVTWEGNVPNSQLPTFMNRASICVLPSFYEGHPKVILEAMACQKAVLGSDAPGIKELIRHGETGWLCGTDSLSIRSALEELLKRPALRSALGARAREFVSETYSLDRVMEQEVSLLAEVMHQYNKT